MVPWTSDGYPIRVPGGIGKKTVLRPGEREVFEYPNSQFGGATLWYHDHTMDLTSMNVYAGLAGAYLLRDEREKTLISFPKDKYEIPLIIQDRSFTNDGELLYGDADFLNKYLDSNPVIRKNNRDNFLLGYDSIWFSRIVTITCKT
jgi:spore coat protein A, manganese oxidase